MHCIWFLLCQFSPTYFDVRNVSFRECTKSFLLLADSMRHRVCQQLKTTFGALPEDGFPYVETCRGEVKE
jgi:hypothetical protein